MGMQKTAVLPHFTIFEACLIQSWLMAWTSPAPLHGRACDRAAFIFTVFARSGVIAGSSQHPQGRPVALTAVEGPHGVAALTLTGMRSPPAASPVPVLPRGVSTPPEQLRTPMGLGC